MKGTGENTPLPLFPPPDNKFLVMTLNSARRYSTTVQSVFEWEKKNQNALAPNAEGARRGAVGAEDRALKARRFSMQLHAGGLRERCKLPSGSRRSPAAKRHLVHFLV